MDKNTLSQYGWVVIVIIILVLMIALASPFGHYIEESAMNTLMAFGEKSNVENLLNESDDGLVEGGGIIQGGGIISGGSAELVPMGPTMEQLGGTSDPYVFEIGATQANYVIGKFNNDYTELTIYKNGIDSDGKMRTWPPTGSAFPSKPELTSVIIKDGVTSIGLGAFERCSNLKTVIIPDSVTTIDNWSFASCDSLTNITIPGGVSTIQLYTFSCCTGLTNVVISNGVTTIQSNAFSGCKNITNITIPSTVELIEEYAFDEGIALTVHGVAGSYAQTWASSHGYTFVAI